MAELTKQELYAHVGADEVQAEHIEKPQVSYWKDVVRRFFSNKVAILSVAVLAVLIVMAIVGPFLSPYNYRTTDVASVSDKLAEVGREALGPDREHWFGVDTLGRDLWARVWMGTRYSLMIGFVAAIVQAIIGVMVGCVSGYCGGMVDVVIMRIVDILDSIPYLIYVIIIMIIFGSGLLPIMLALTLTGWLSMARMVRGQILTLKSEDYILAARNLDTKAVSIMLKHLIPNCMGIIIVSLSMAIPNAIFSEAFLSFLGIGLAAPLTSLGQLISTGIQEMQNYPYQLIIPSAVISLLMLSLQLIGDGLRDAVDPKLRR